MSYLSADLNSIKMIQEIPHYNNADYWIPLLPIFWKRWLINECPTEILLIRFKYLERKKELINVQRNGRRLNPNYESLNAERHLLEDELVDRGLDLEAILASV